MVIQNTPILLEHIFGTSNFFMYQIYEQFFLNVGDFRADFENINTLFLGLIFDTLNFLCIKYEHFF